MHDEILIKIARFSGVAKYQPEIVYLPFETADESSRKYFQNAWSASIDGEIVLVDEDLEDLWENLADIVFDSLEPKGEEIGEGLIAEDFLDEEDEAIEDEEDIEE